MNPEPSQPVTWEWLERELASRLTTLRDQPGHQPSTSFIEVLEDQLRQNSGLKYQPVQKIVQEQRS